MEGNNEKNLAIKFYEEFLQVMNQDDIRKIAKSTYKNSTNWTQTIKLILAKVINSENVSYEYYRLDMLNYEYISMEDIENVKKDYVYFDEFKSKLKVHAWKNRYAIEYENDKIKWVDELVKLSHIRADLKVMVCYSEYPKKKYLDNKRQLYLDLIDKKMKYATKTIKRVENEALKDQWLIIIGPTGKDLKDIDFFNDFIGYQMVDHELKRIIL